MAIFYTELTGNETEGERNVYLKFKDNLPDEFLIWHNKELRDKIKNITREIDFIILHPVYGIWVVEVKDWIIDQLYIIKENNWSIIQNGREIIKPDPFRQVRENKYLLKELMEREKILIHKKGIHKGKLIVPLHSFVIFTNISEEEVAQHRELKEYIKNKNVWLNDILEEEFTNREEWIEMLLLSRDVSFQTNLNENQINKIKSIIGVPVVFNPEGEEIGTLDSYQEKLVKLPANSKIIIEGPAGSGKSIVLIKRALYIAEQNPYWRIGIICFNALMANYLRTLLKIEHADNGLKQRIEIYDIYNWAGECGLPEIKYLFSHTREPDEALKEALNKYGVLTKYDALLVDEGQDSTRTMFRLYFKMLRDVSSSFTFFYDERQTIYKHREIRKILSEAGINIDKEKKLVKQQRSVLILIAITFYERFNEPYQDINVVLQKALKLCNKMFYGIKNFVLGLVTGMARLFGYKRGVEFSEIIKDKIDLIKITSISEGIRDICNYILEKVEEGKRYSDFLIIFPARTTFDVEYNFSYGFRRNFNVKLNLAEMILRELYNNKIPYIYIDSKQGKAFNGISEFDTYDNRRNADLSSNTVKVMTIFTSKGLDAKEVFILDFDRIEEIFEEERIAKIAYVGLTRARDHLRIYYGIENRIVKTLKEVINQIENKSISF